jgi:hypothetical protein
VPHVVAVEREKIEAPGTQIGLHIVATMQGTEVWRAVRPVGEHSPDLRQSLAAAARPSGVDRFSNPIPAVKRQPLAQTLVPASSLNVDQCGL